MDIIGKGVPGSRAMHVSEDDAYSNAYSFSGVRNCLHKEIEL